MTPLTTFNSKGKGEWREMGKFVNPYIQFSL